MKTTIAMIAALFVSATAWAEDVSDSDKLVCSVNSIHLCLEVGGCFDVPPTEVDVPRFIVVDTRKGTLSTTKASGLNRSTTASNYQRENGRIVMQGIQNERAFSITIEEDIGALTGAVARDGIAVSVFGACTDADI